MQSFPSSINISLRDKFPLLKYNLVLKSLRKAIYEHVILYDYREEDMKSSQFTTENNYFDINKFFLSFGITDDETKDDLYLKVEEELNSYGWYCQLTFAKTAMFIYSSSDSPTSCWKDEF